MIQMLFKAFDAETFQTLGRELDRRVGWAKAAVAAEF
jgi:hypothetical protein